MWQRFKGAMARFMAGRHGPDELSRALMWCGLALVLLTMIPALRPLYMLWLIPYVWGMFRMLSRNNAKRDAENRRWLEFSGRMRPELRQAFVRVKNFRKYRYYKCPECKARLRLPRKVGEVTVTCGKCKHQFRAKA